MTQAVICHVVAPAHRLKDGRAGVANAAALSRLVGHALGAGGAGQGKAGVLGSTLTRVQHKQFQVQPTGVLSTEALFLDVSTVCHNPQTGV